MPDGSSSIPQSGPLRARLIEPPPPVEMPGEFQPRRLARRAIPVLVLLTALGLVGPGLSLWLTALPAALAVLLIGVVVAIPRLGPGPPPPPDAVKFRRALFSTRGALVNGTREAIQLVRNRDPLLLIGAVGYWAWDNAVLWATFQAFDASPALSVILMGYLIGQLGGLLPLPGGVGGIDGGLIGALIVFGTPAARAQSHRSPGALRRAGGLLNAGGGPGGKPRSRRSSPRVVPFATACSPS